jgi:hypothetical protein
MYSINPTKVFKVIVLLVCFPVFATAQSTNSDYPTPVTTNEIQGKIAARDVGDPRPTRYFYTFTGTPGDLNITIESENLNGDVDIFTVNNLRPLAKISLFETGYGVTTTANIYLRKREPLLLRIEAKTASEQAGTYHIKFSGGFEAIADTKEQPEEPTIKTKSSDGTVRVNSVGARIEEPKPPVKEKPVETKTETAKTTTPKTKPTTTTKTPTTTEPNTEATTSNTTAPTTTPKKETPAARRKRLAAERAEAIRKRKEETAAERKRKQEEAAEQKRQSQANSDANNTSNESGNTTNKTSNKTSASKTTPKEPTPDPMASVRLIVETKDGQRIERTMNEVRRVNVEKGVLVIVFMDGKIERIPMTNVQKMAIEPIF